jgi:hypothetical protein
MPLEVTLNLRVGCEVRHNKHYANKACAKLSTFFPYSLPEHIIVKEPINQSTSYTLEH